MKTPSKNSNNKKNNWNIIEKSLIRLEERKRKTKTGPKINSMLSLKEQYMV